MLNGTQQKLIDAVFALMRPIAKALLRSGVGYREFSEISKAAFVNIATDSYGVRGRPTNVSRVAAMTGLSRKEVKRLQGKHSEGRQTQVDKNIPPIMVLGEWQSNKQYVNKDGSPRTLNFDGPGPTFASLVKAIGGDVPAGAMRTELKRVGCVAELPDGSLELVRPMYLESDLDLRLARSIQNQLRLHAETILFNTDRENQNDLRAESVTYTAEMRRDDIQRFKRVSTNKIENLSSSFLDLVNAYEAIQSADNISDAEKLTVGVGTFYFEESHNS